MQNNSWIFFVFGKRRIANPPQDGGTPVGGKGPLEFDHSNGINSIGLWNEKNFKLFWNDDERKLYLLWNDKFERACTFLFGFNLPRPYNQKQYGTSWYFVNRLFNLQIHSEVLELECNLNFTFVLWRLMESQKILYILIKL